jgi:hypothetical protein
MVSRYITLVQIVDRENTFRIKKPGNKTFFILS